MKRSLVFVTTLATACVLAMRAAAAAEPAAQFPTRALRVVVPAAPGGSTDLFARIMAPKLYEALGQPVVVENRAGAATNVGTTIVAKSAPDGYTLLLTTSSVAINISLYPKQEYHPLRDLAPVSLIADAPNFLLVHPSVQAQSLSQLIALAKSKPGQLSYASSGSGSTNHLAMELLKTSTGTDFVHVPYKGGGPALTDLLGGRVQVMVAVAMTALPYVRSGKLRALGVSGMRRLPQAPDVPTMNESLPGFDVSVWYGILVAAGTPAAIVRTLNAATLKVLAMPNIKEKLADIGVTTSGSSPEEFSRHLKTEMDKWGQVVKASGAVAE